MPIRLATIHDWPAIQQLLVQLEYPDAADLPDTKMERMLNDQAEVLLVYEEARGGDILPPSGEVLGFLSLHFSQQIGLERDFARISYFTVDESARSQGIGKELEEHATSLARERNCHLIEVHCHSRRVRAHEFYARQGYAESPKYLVKRLV
jgi:GNAT superfamily N-acetyltransferase